MGLIFIAIGVALIVANILQIVIRGENTNLLNLYLNVASAVLIAVGLLLLQL